MDGLSGVDGGHRPVVGLVSELVFSRKTKLKV